MRDDRQQYSSLAGNEQPDLNTLMRIIKNDSYSNTMYEYLQNSKAWSERFHEFLKGKKTLPLLYDPFFKKIFNAGEHKQRLSELISCILGQQVNVLEVLPNENSGFLGVFVIMDMVVQMEDGSIANIEIQKIPYDFPAERISCYSSDLVLRQYRKIVDENDSSIKNEASYKRMRKVHTIIFFEKSNASLISPKDNRLYFHVGRTYFNTQIKMELLQEYHLISLDTFKKYRYSDIKEGRIDITAYDYDVTQYKGVVNDTMKRNRLMYLSLFVAENSEEIDQLVKVFPELSDIRQELNEYLVRPKEALIMFSEALRIMDRNTASLMVDEYREMAEKAIEEAERMVKEAQKEAEEKAREQVEEAQREAEKEAKAEAEKEVKAEVERRVKEAEKEVKAEVERRVKEAKEEAQKEAEEKAKAEAEKEVKEEIERLKAEIEQLKKNQQ